MVETVSRAEGSVLIYDYDFGLAMHRLNEFVLGDWHEEHVLRWGLRQLAAAFAGAGDKDVALGALATSTLLQPKSMPAAKERMSAAAFVPLQDYFAISHECVHLALDEGRLSSLADIHRDEVQRMTAELRERSIPSPSPASMLREAAMAALGGDEELFGRTYSDRVIESVAESLSIDSLGRGRPHLEEELLCDAVATELTVSAVGPQLEEEVVVMAIFLCLSNLRSLEFIRSMNPSVPDTARAAAYRLSLWRRWACSTRTLPSDTIHAGLRRISETYAKSVSDLLFFALRPRLLEGCELIGDKPLGPDLVARLAKESDPDVLARILSR